MRFPGRRKLFLVLILVMTIALLFLCFQIFSLHLLSKENRSNGNYLWANSPRRRKSPVRPRYFADEPADPEEHQHLHNRLLDKYLEELRREEGYGELDPGGAPTSAWKSDAAAVGDDDVPVGWWEPPLHGVPPRRLAAYREAQETGALPCASDPERLIPFSQVNDDYCDCPADGADEPGTEACASARLPASAPPLRFFCRFQLPGAVRAHLDAASDDAGLDLEGASSLNTIPLQWTLNSRVNDGLCDCCDGSDEWRREAEAASAFSASEAPSERPERPRPSPCANTCALVVTSLKRRLIAQREGRDLKRKYIVEAKRHFSPLYGEESEFYLLSVKCFQKHTGEYQYTVCPFRQVQQQHKQGLTGLNLGRKPSWHDLGRKVLLMSGGSDQLCPDRQKRRSFIYFRCAVKEEILSAMETDVCVYSFQISTPAAC